MATHLDIPMFKHPMPQRHPLNVGTCLIWVKNLPIKNSFRLNVQFVELLPLGFKLLPVEGWAALFLLFYC
jgi:hypothetical protein